MVRRKSQCKDSPCSVSGTAQQSEHSTTLQRPFELLIQERPYLNSIPQPYMGISPRVLIKSVSNKTIEDKYNFTPTPIIYIPNRDMQGYDALIPSIASIAPILATYEGLLWR